MDLLDKASSTEELIMEKRIASVRAASHSREFPPKGKCYNCNEDFEKQDQRLFCDSECTKDFELARRK